jgi:hypothetical protein
MYQKCIKNVSKIYHLKPNINATSFPKSHILLDTIAIMSIFLTSYPFLFFFFPPDRIHPVILLHKQMSHFRVAFIPLNRITLLKIIHFSQSPHKQD